MILSLRQRHRHIFAALTLLLPVTFVVGVAARKSVLPVSDRPATSAISQSFAAVGQPRADLFPKTGVQVKLFQEQTPPGRFAVVLTADKNFAQPDVLVYWLADGSMATNTIPDQAVLLGSFGPQPLLLPNQAADAGSTGTLMLYSLADGEIVEVSKPFALQRFNASTP